MHHALALAIIGSLTLPAAALGNDFSVGGQGHDLYPFAQTEVVMQSESIDLVQVRHREWSIVATYVFATDSDEAQALRIGFPELGCSRDRDDCGSLGFNNMRTTADGVLLDNELGELAPEEGETDINFLPDAGEDTLSESPNLGRIWVYDILVPAGGVVTVEHRYDYVASHLAGRNHIDFITTTGALWPAPIGHAEFRVWFQEPLVWADYPTTWGEPAVAVGSVDVEGGARTSFGFHWVFDDWVPQENLVVSYSVDWRDDSHVRCPSVNSISGRVATDGLDSTLDWLAADYDRGRLDLETARACRGLIHVEHGLAVVDRELAAVLFPYSYASNQHENRWFRTLPEDDTPEMLSSAEELYIQVMQAIEERLGAQLEEEPSEEGSNEGGE